MSVGTVATPGDLLSETFRPTIHNAFDPSLAPHLKDILVHCPSVEIDLWDDATAPSGGASPGSWYVRHGPFSGNVSNGTSPGDLKSCLYDVAGFLRANEQPSCTFLFLDKQQGWGPSRAPKDLDTVLVEAFGSLLFRPADLVREPSGDPRDEIRKNGWPPLGALRNRVSVVLTGGRWGYAESEANKVLAQYVSDRDYAAACFVAPEIAGTIEISPNVPGFGPRATRWVVMFNFSVAHLQLAKSVHSAGYLSRVYYAAKNSTAYIQCIANKVHFIAIDRFDQHEWNDGLMAGRF